jgi:hypothetical protein
MCSAPIQAGLVNANEANLVLTNTYVNDGNVILTKAENNITQPRSLWDYGIYCLAPIPENAAGSWLRLT